MKQQKVSQKILQKGRTIFFNEEAHKYTDDLGNKYVQRDHGGYSDSYSKTRMVALNKIDENATKLIIKVEAADEGLLDGNEIEKTFEPIIIDIKND